MIMIRMDNDNDNNDGGQLSVRLAQHTALAPSLVHCTMMIMIIMMEDSCLYA
jgi:hypothetical protein